jgi:hypothetical protein
MAERYVKPQVKAPLIKASGEHIFWCNDGTTFTDIRELARGLAHMSDNTFFHHVSFGYIKKNDFAYWVREVIGDEQLASSLERTTSRYEAAACVIARLAHYR